MFFNSVKEMDRRKEINRLLSKGMSNIYLNVTTEKKWRSQNFNFLSLKNLSPGQSLGGSRILKLLVATYKSEDVEQICVWYFYYFNFERNHGISKSKSPYIFLKKNINFNKD